MNRKHNPWAALVGLLLGLLLVILCAGCASTDATEPTEMAGRFVIEAHSMDGSIYGVRVITDTETGVQYLVYTNGQGCAMAALQEKEG